MSKKPEEDGDCYATAEVHHTYGEIESISVGVRHDAAEILGTNSNLEAAFKVAEIADQKARKVLKGKKSKSVWGFSREYSQGWEQIFGKKEELPN
jgi:hypothetical protein